MNQITPWNEVSKTPNVPLRIMWTESKVGGNWGRGSRAGLCVSYTRCTSNLRNKMLRETKSSNPGATGCSTVPLIPCPPLARGKSRISKKAR